MEGNRILHLIAVVAIGWGITYALRSLPFVLFSRKSRKLPPWVGRVGILISPVIIAFLIVYSYSSLEWRTSAPYAAGAITVALQFFRRNPLISIIGGTAAYMTLLLV